MNNLLFNSNYHPNSFALGILHSVLLCFLAFCDIQQMSNLVFSLLVFYILKERTGQSCIVWVVSTVRVGKINHRHKKTNLYLLRQNGKAKVALSQVPQAHFQQPSTTMCCLLVISIENASILRFFYDLLNHTQWMILIELSFKFNSLNFSNLPIGGESASENLLSLIRAGVFPYDLNNTQMNRL